MGASVRLTWWLEPVIGIDNVRRSSVCCRSYTNTSASCIAPVCTVLSHAGLSISTSVDHKVRLVISFNFEGIGEHLNVVKLIVTRVPLRLKFAWISATFVTLMLAVETIVISNTI